MDWTVVGALGEAVGALGVILSLLYLARQIQSASLKEQRARWDQAIDAGTLWSQSLATEGDLADIFLRGISGGASALTPPERVRFYSSLLSIFRSYERVIQYSAEGGVHTWGKDALTASFRDLVAMPGVQDYWSERRHWFGSLMQTEIDQLIADAGNALATSYAEEGSPGGAEGDGAVDR